MTVDWDEDQPIDADELVREAYKDAYENPVKLDADGGMHSDSWDRARAWAGYSRNEHSGLHTIEEPVEIEVEVNGEEDKVEVMEIEPHYLYGEVVEAMVLATKDQYEGRECDPDKLV